MNKRFALVHNGIVENFLELKVLLLEKGYVFSGQTDSEILVNWIEYACSGSKSFEEVAKGIEQALGQVENPDILFGCRVASPLVVGKFAHGMGMASDVSALGREEKEVWFVPEKKVIFLTKSEAFCVQGDQVVENVVWQQVDDANSQSEKGEYEFFTLKEIHEQGKVLGELVARYVENKTINLGIKNIFPETGLPFSRIVVIACGTSWHAGMVGEYFIEKIAGVPVEMEYASEFRYRSAPVTSTDLVIAISQSGETADTLAAVEYAKSQGAIILGITNVPYSALAREAHSCIFLYSGKEVGVAATKTFTAQTLVLYLLACKIAQSKGKKIDSLLNFESLSGEIELIIKNDNVLQEMVRTINDAHFVLYLGRLLGVPVAYEGALKLKELSYVPVQAYPAGEMKHGPLALVDHRTVVVCVECGNETTKLESNIQEVKARGGNVLLIQPKGENEFISVILASVQLQLVAYYSSLFKGLDVDKPRNLAKTVTVE